MTISSDREAIRRAKFARAAAAELTALFDGAENADEVKLSFDVAGTERVVLLPRPAVDGLLEILTAFGNGGDPTVVPMAMELSSGMVGELLGVSRQYAVRLIDEGKLNARRVGNRRRVPLSEAVAYLRRDDRRRVDAFKEWARTSQEEAETTGRGRGAAVERP